MTDGAAAKRNLPLLFAKGMAMGAADVVPGVSGGTIAFISGIYDELLDAIKGINLTALRVLFSAGPARFWRQINGTFLLVLGAGILASVLSLAKLVSHLLATQPLLIWSFFFGLVLASVIYMVRDQRHWRTPQLLALALGAAVALAIAFAPPLAVAATPVAVFGAGMLAICAMILPGISGSFILLLIGMYPVIINAVSELDLAVLALFGAGAAVGLAAFSRVLSWLLHRFRATTLALLIGFLLGSLPVVWPWQTAALAAGPQPGVRQLMLPGQYQELLGNPQLLPSLALMAVGLAVVLGLEYGGSFLARKRR